MKNPSSTATAAKASPAITAGWSGTFLGCMLRDEGGAASVRSLAKLNTVNGTHRSVSILRPVLCFRSPQNNLT